jgi:hypothetical protein
MDTCYEHSVNSHNASRFSIPVEGNPMNYKTNFIASC